MYSGTRARAISAPGLTHYLLAAVFLAGVMLMSSPAYADIAGTICAVVDEIQNNIGRGLATMAILAIGASAVLGKVSWSMAVVVAVGIACIFGAVPLAEEMGFASC